MKISFSTLGCPTWKWNEILSTAKDLGYDGIEVRGIENELYAPKMKLFSNENVDLTKKQLQGFNLTIPCLTSAATLCREDDEFANEVMDYAILANTLKTPYIRVMGEATAQPIENIDLNKIAENLKKAGAIAKSHGVTVLVETNGILANSQNMLKVLEISGTEGIGVLWDIHHPFRYFGEDLDKTYDLLKKYIKHVHIKDSLITSDKVKYKLVGEGDVPIKDCILLLKKENYDGFVSLEWVKRWYSDLEEPGIVFMQYVNYIKNLL